MGLRADIYKSKTLGDCSNGGISGRYDTVTVVNVSGPFTPDETAPPVILQHGNVAGTVKAVPAEWNALLDDWVLALPSMDVVGPMMGGCYVSTSDSRFSEKAEELAGGRFYGAVALHDRFETAAEYRALSI